MLGGNPCWPKRERKSIAARLSLLRAKCCKFLSLPTHLPHTSGTEIFFNFCPLTKKKTTNWKYFQTVMQKNSKVQDVKAVLRAILLASPLIVLACCVNTRKWHTDTQHPEHSSFSAFGKMGRMLLEQSGPPPSSALQHIPPSHKGV